ncbi:MAG TPA: sigma-70 family RNA polymerase sigma factor [Candidatus Limnocylindrales bacterium]|nr:sigma-70 family RNA polymerase sigma factor [Candidatus Limnocylindrales bacterium]
MRDIEANVSREDDRDLVERLRSGDEAAFRGLVERYHQPLVRLALTYVARPDVAEEIVQDTWIGVIRGIDTFEARSSVKTWIFRILTYQAMSGGKRERRSIPFSVLAGREAEGDEPAVDPSRFRGPDDRYPGGWIEHPDPWGDGESIMLSQEMQAVVAASLETLPPAQRLVVTMRDVQGWTSEEVCEALEISQGNQRVLLHRARGKVRAALERYRLEAAV